MIGRIATAIATGVVVTVAVLFTMQALIATARRDLDESGSRHFVDFVRVERAETLERRDRRPEKPPEPAAPPPSVPQPRTDVVDPEVRTVNIAPVPVQAEVSVGGLGLVPSDGEYLPIVRVQPLYPWRAQSQGIEGYVIVEFTVAADGSVTDVVIVEADPPEVFDKAVIEAVAKWKYKPRVVNGEPIAVRDVRVRFPFRLDEG